MAKLKRAYTTEEDTADELFVRSITKEITPEICANMGHKAISFDNTIEMIVRVVVAMIDRKYIT